MIDVCHVVDAMGDATTLWGKERVIHELMREQRASGTIRPHLVVFTETLLANVAAAEGFPVECLERSHTRSPHRSFPALIRYLHASPQLVLHTHSYKANIITRLARASGAPMAGLVSTCHGWFDETLLEKAYNTLDRATSFVSDVATACDPAMVARLPVRQRAAYVRNAVRDLPQIGAHERSLARAHFGWPEDEFIVGMLGRLNPLKGALNFADAAARDPSDTVWAVAGSGPLRAQIEARRSARFRCVGYVDPSTLFLAAIDVYVQPSTIEGQSMSLLEAMRAGLPIVATRAGATEDAVRHEAEALLVDVASPEQIVGAVERLRFSALLRRGLAQRARARFESDFRVASQHDAYFAHYLAALSRCRKHVAA